MTTQSLRGVRADRKHSYRSIEQIASGLRKMLGLDVLDRFDAQEFFNQTLADMTLVYKGGNVQLREAIEDCPQEGLTRFDTDSGFLEVVLSSATFELLEEDHVRARSTVAHECGHAVLHTDQIIRLAGMSLKSQFAFHRERSPHQACEDTEWQANAFGSSLLMPGAGVQALEAAKSGLTAAKVAVAFGVSIESATYRIETYRRSLGL